MTTFDGGEGGGDKIRLVSNLRDCIAIIYYQVRTEESINKCEKSMTPAMHVCCSNQFLCVKI